MTWYQHCDGPGCTSHARGTMLRGFLTVRENGGGEHHFCGWECVVKFGARFEPPTVIGFGGAS